MDSFVSFQWDLLQLNKDLPSVYIQQHSYPIRRYVVMWQMHALGLFNTQFKMNFKNGSQDGSYEATSGG